MLKKYLQAELYVIGNGKLYNKDAKLGKYELAEDSYEKFFIKNLLVDNQIMESVHFLGTLGELKRMVF